MEDFIARLRQAYKILQRQKRERFGRRVSFGDLIVERGEIAADYGFGEGTTCYDSALIIGDVTVGRHTWIGPHTVLDGSGGLVIGDHVAVSAGVQIYTHDAVSAAVTRGRVGVERSPTTIGSGVYIGPHCVIQRGVSIGEGAVIGANSLVNRDIPAGMKAWGTPVRVIGPVGDIEEGNTAP